MWMHPGAAGYKEQHHYKVEKDDFAYRDDFHFNKGSNPSMHIKKPDHCDSEFKHNYKHSDHQYTTSDHHHNNHGKSGPNMHMVMKPADHNDHHNYGRYYGPNKHGMTYSETIYEQEEKLLHGNKYNNSNFAGHHNYGKLSYGGCEGGGYTDHHNYSTLNYGGNERYYSDEWKRRPPPGTARGWMIEVYRLDEPGHTDFI